MSELVGKTLGSRFRVDAVLGEGSMGCVYRALDTQLERNVAIKVLHPELRADSQFIARFAREARIIAQLSSNPHVITIYDVGNTDEGLQYLVTEFLTGRCLSDVMAASSPPSRTWVLDVTLQILSALIDSHAKRVVSRLETYQYLCNGYANHPLAR